MHRRLLVWFGCFAILFAATPHTLAQGFKFLEVTVVDPDGQPMADVPVDINIDGMEFPMPTDEKGIVSVNIPADQSSELELSVSHKGYASLKARWAKGASIPDKFTIPMRQGKTIGGIVHDEQGKPVEGVKVEALATAHDESSINSGKGELRMDIPRDLGVTDSEGRWQTDSGPTEDVAIQMRFLHPDFVKEEGFGYVGGTWEELLAKNKIVVLQKGVVVSGKVVDGQQKPIAGARIVTGPDRYWSNKLEVTTDESGKYQLPEPQAGRLILTVTAPGYAPELKTFQLANQAVNTDFVLQPGNTLRVRVLDRDGKPVEGVRVYAEEWRGHRSLDLSEDEKTNAEGYWEWTKAPADEIKYGFSKNGHIGLEIDLKPSDKVHTLTLNPVVVVRGKVIDKASGEPIESFKHVEGVWWEPNDDSYFLQSHNVQVGKNGAFVFRMTSACAKFCVRVEAEGFRPTVSRELLPSEGEIEIEFPLEKASAPAGVVHTPQGQPAADATVALGGTRMPVMISNGRVQEFSADAVTTTDGEGRFQLPVPDVHFTIVVVHESGWAELNNPSDEQFKTITLSPWSQVEGTMYVGDRPSGGERVVARIPRRKDIPSTSQWYSNSKTDDAGEFHFGKLRSGPALVHGVVKYAVLDADSWMTAYSQLNRVELAPGSTTQVNIGGAGRKVEGQLVVADEDRDQVDWNMALVELIKGEYKETDKEFEVEFAAGIQNDGRFTIVDVLPGSYTMKVTLYPDTAASNGRWYPIATLTQPCEIVDGHRNEPVDLGSFALRINKKAN